MSSPSQRQALNEAKSRVARALTAAGVPSMYVDTTRTLRARAARVFGPANPGESTTDYFDRVADQVPRTKQFGSGCVAAPLMREPLRIRPWQPKPHPRAAEIDAQPTPVSMSGRVTQYVGFEERGR